MSTRFDKELKQQRSMAVERLPVDRFPSATRFNLRWTKGGDRELYPCKIVHRTLTGVGAIFDVTGI